MSQTIYTNPSMQRSFVSNAFKSYDLNKYLKIIFNGTNNAEKSVLVFPGMEYTIVFYDADYGSRRSVTGLVQEIYCNQVKFKEKKTMSCNACKNNKSCKGSACNCIYNPPDVSSYDDPKTYYIPIDNIMDIEYIKRNNNNSSNVITEEEKLVLLGISATMVKAVIIHLDLFTDDHPNAVKSIDLQKDNVYNVVYEVNGTTYELIGKVSSINVKDGKTESHVVRENVGMDNSVYNCNTTRSDFLASAPSVKNVYITFDTSYDFTGAYETICLSNIRDCTLLQNGIEYVLNDEYNYTINDNVVTLIRKRDGYKQEISVNNLLSLYNN